VHVARLAGLPEQVVARADQLLDQFERGTEADQPVKIGDLTEALPLFQHQPPPKKAAEISPVSERLKEIDPDQLSPRQAMDILYELKAMDDGDRR